MSYKDSNENRDLMEGILQSFELNELIPRFRREQIDLECLLLMTENDMEKLIPQINLRIKFRAKLIAWRMLKGDDFNIFDDVQSETSVNSRESKTIDKNVNENRNHVLLKEQSKICQSLSSSSNNVYIKDDISRKKFVDITRKCLSAPINTSLTKRSSSPHEHSLKKAAEHWKSVEALERSRIDKHNDDSKIASSKHLWKHDSSETSRPKKSYDDVKSASGKQLKHVTFYNETGRSKGRQDDMRYERVGCKDFGHDTRYSPKKYKSTERRDDTLPHREDRGRDIDGKRSARHLPKSSTECSDMRMMYKGIPNGSANLKDDTKMCDQLESDQNSFPHEMRLKKTREKVDERSDEGFNREPSTSTTAQKHSKDDVQQRKFVKDQVPYSRLSKRLLSQSESSTYLRKYEHKHGADAKKRNHVDKKYDDEDPLYKKKLKMSASHNENVQKTIWIETSKEMEEKENSQMCFRCSKFGHIKRECPEPAKCFVCKETGHGKQECPKRYESVNCFFCQDIGHIARFCKLRLQGSARMEEGYRSN